MAHLQQTYINHSAYISEYLRITQKYTYIYVPGECQEPQYSNSSVRNGKEMGVLFPLRTRNDVFSCFCARNGTEMRVLFPLRTRLFLRTGAKTERSVCATESIRSKELKSMWINMPVLPCR